MNKLLPGCLDAISYGYTPTIAEFEGKEYVRNTSVTDCKNDCQTGVVVKQVKIELCSRCPKF